MKILSVRLTFSGNYYEIKNDNNNINKWESYITIRAQRNDLPTSDSIRITGELNNEIRRIFKKYSSYVDIDSHILRNKMVFPIIYNIYCKDIPDDYKNDFQQELLTIRDKQLEKENNHKKILMELL